MNFSFACIIFLLFAECTVLHCTAMAEEKEASVKKLSYPESVKEIVKDLIASWNSPLVYLKKRGYITPVGAALNLLQRMDSKHTARERQIRSNDENNSPGDLANLFRTLFSDNDKTASDKIKTKLGVGWDMDKLKTTVRNEAQKFYDEYFNRPSLRSDSNTPLAINKQVAQLYPSLVSSPSNTEEEEHNKDMSRPMVQKETKFLNGIAKLLSSRDKLKPLPSSTIDDNKQLVDISAVPTA